MTIVSTAPHPALADAPPGNVHVGQRLLIVATNPADGASTRVRMLQFVPLWQKAGYECEFHAFFSSRVSKSLYRQGHLLRKVRAVAVGGWRRTQLLWRAPRQHDILIVHRELYPLGFLWKLDRLKQQGLRIIYDYDDAMFLPQRPDRPWLSRIERPGSTDELIRRSDWVVAGNRFLADHAGRIHPRVTMIPSVVDPRPLTPRAPEPSRPPVIGWIGSHSTAKYLEDLVPVFRALGRSHLFSVRIVGAEPPRGFEGLYVARRPWEMGTEWDEFAACDIGVYPLWNDSWAQGKCGFKAIQFMAAGVPVVASRVGANCDVIQDGVNGFLVGCEEEWVDRVERLLGDPALRARMGAAGRRTVDERYSLRAAAVQWLDVLDHVAREDP